MNSSIDEQWISPREAARRLGVSEPTLRRYLRSGHIPFYQPAGKKGRILIPLSRLKADAGPDASEPLPSDVKPQSRSAAGLAGPSPQWMGRRPSNASE